MPDMPEGDPGKQTRPQDVANALPGAPTPVPVLDYQGPSREPVIKRPFRVSHFLGGFVPMLVIAASGLASMGEEDYAIGLVFGLVMLVGTISVAFQRRWRAGVFIGGAALGLGLGLLIGFGICAATFRM